PPSTVHLRARGCFPIGATAQRSAPSADSAAGSWGRRQVVDHGLVQNRAFWNDSSPAQGFRARQPALVFHPESRNPARLRIPWDKRFVEGLFLTPLASEICRVHRIPAALVLRRLRIHAQRPCHHRVLSLLPLILRSNDRRRCRAPFHPL